MKCCLSLVFIFIFCFIVKSEEPEGKFVFYPYASQKKFHCSFGMLFTTTHKDVTEEIQFRIPSIDVHATKKITKNIYLTGRVNAQILQNHFSAGFRWNLPVTTRTTFGITNEVGYWFGSLKFEGFNTSANGWVYYPGISAGLLFGKDVYVTLKAEAILNVSYKSYVGENLAVTNQKFYNGEALSIILEQPFYKDTWFVLGFRAMYVNDFWQTWPLFETLDRNIFYPQLIMGFII
jgi:hypothetical protein